MLWRRRRARPRIGDHELVDARRLADLERASGEVPTGCAWLDDRTVEDLDLGAVFAAIDRTRTATGAQMLWRSLAAPAHDLEVLANRERCLAALADDDVRAAVTARLGTSTIAEPPHVPRLLWEAPARPLSAALFVAMWGALLVCAIAAWLWPPALIGLVLVIAANVFIDDWSKLRLAHQAYALEVLDELLGRARELVRVVPQELAAKIRTDLGVGVLLHRRMAILSVRDPFDVFDLLRAGFLVRLAVTRSAMRLVEAERLRLRRVVQWFGEIDALAAVASLRVERPTSRVPMLAAGKRHIAATDLVHPAVPDAIGNSLELSDGLLVTGSNMSGKSTFLRTVAVNAILAQSIHTTFGTWRATPLRVHSVMRVADDPAHGLSTYAVEVAAIGELIAAATSDALFVIDEPFHGTNPAIRVPIVVAVLEHLVSTGLVIAATHDLDVANRLDARFTRGYFDEQAGTFDRRLRAGIAPATNAVEVLRRAGYPAAILDRLGRPAEKSAS